MLSKKEKKLLADIWTSLVPVAEDIGSDALLRMFATYPGTKTYFSHIDVSTCSPHLLSHGKKIVLAIAEGAQDISQLAVSLEPLQTLHAYQLRIDPTNFKLLEHFGQLIWRLGLAVIWSGDNGERSWLLPSVELFSHCMLVTLACHMGDDFTPVAHAAMDKYLSAFAAVLAEKYR